MNEISESTERLSMAVSYVEVHGFGVHEDFDNLILSAAGALAEARESHERHGGLDHAIITDALPEADLVAGRGA